LGIGFDSGGSYVYINPGSGVIYAYADEILGSHPLIVPDKLKVGYFTNYVPVPGVTRYDLICIGIDTITEGEESGIEGDPRVFIYPTQIDPQTGRPKRQVQTIPTRSKYVAKTLWVTGSTDYNTAKNLPAPEGYMVLGWAANSQDSGVYAIETRDFPAIVLPQHREKAELDHPDRSVKANHVELDVIGNFTTGTDLSLKAISNEIRGQTGVEGARGNKATINERLEAIITEDGTIVEEPVIEMIDARLTDLFAGVVDSKGNLMSSALSGSGVLAKAAAVMGVAPHEQYVQLPHGYSQDQCSWIIGLAQIGFTPGSQSVHAQSVVIECHNLGRLVNCRALVTFDGAATPIETRGSANFLTIGYESN